MKSYSPSDIHKDDTFRPQTRFVFVYRRIRKAGPCQANGTLAVSGWVGFVYERRGEQCAPQSSYYKAGFTKQGEFDVSITKTKGASLNRIDSLLKKNIADNMKNRIS